MNNMNRNTKPKTNEEDLKVLQEELVVATSSSTYQDEIAELASLREQQGAMLRRF